jgi:glutamate-1-semialdehyde 2,1-aminomutase
MPTGDMRDYRATLRQDTAMQKHVNGVLRARGILKGDSKFYLSTAHDAADVAQTLDAFRAALASLPGSRVAA